MKVTVETYRDIHLNDKQVEEISIAYLKQLVAPGEYLRKSGGKIWLKQDDPDWRHGSVSEETVREATEEDIAVFKVIALIQKKRKTK